MPRCFGGDVLTVAYIRQRREKGYLSVGVRSEGGVSALVVSERDFMKMGPLSLGDEIDDGVYSRLLSLDEKFRSKKKAFSVLSYGDNSKRRLLYKLTSSGIDKACAESTVSEMEALGYLNESRQIEREVLRCAERLWGPRKIMSRLISKGYNAADVRSVIGGLISRGELDFDSSRTLLCERAEADGLDSEQTKKLLYKYGYTVC